jgi:carbon monoxide dehydrogenase subunit G
MEMSGEYRIAASREAVWAALNDPAILKEAIPGCQSLEKLSDTEMTATVVSKIGPVKATFNGNVTLSNIRPPEGYTISGEGKGGVAGFAKGGADVALVADGADTILRYTAKAQVGGKLAQVGARLIDATAKQMADQFFGAFAAKVGAGAPAAAAASVKETTVEDVIKDVVVTAEAIEERAEVAAGRGFLGGPMMWGLIVLIVIVLLLIFLR